MSSLFEVAMGKKLARAAALVIFFAAPSANALSDGGASTAPATPPGGAKPRSLIDAPRPIQDREEAPDDYELRRAQDGSGDLLYEAPGFSARVARDGTVHFRDKHVSGIKLLPFLPGGPPSNVPTLQSTLRGLGRKQPAPPPGARRDPTDDAIRDETRDPSTAVSRYRPDPREVCVYPRPCYFDAPVLSIGARANFDLTDELMRIAGQDPYRYQKARFLGTTREMRIHMAARAHARDLARSSGELAARLAAIACNGDLRPAERRAIIDALRAEVDTGTAGGRAQSEQITRFLADLDRGDRGVRCPP